ncbi:MAG: AarF/ABC1/UbiB kinase family protein [Flavobacteriaceae bacterium]|nr:AarF/ABC1/UbiB kinase family protein [Flavobacteriaceae bacterium]MDG1965927.1 AarF/ABC1/UbiB kinase family protein [Flavobacteriaceae bacterium]
MKTLDYIPTNKIARASNLVSTGFKLGGNYLKYYGEKALNVDGSRKRLDEENAKDIYNSLKTLKGSALKVAQMLSMEKNLLPRAYVDQFSLSQFSVPPLSWPLVKNMIRKYLGANPESVFDTFAAQSKNAASIGQVHQATKDGKKLAVKIQYPGVADSISSDLSIVKPIALRMFNLKGKDTDKYFQEVENKLREETNYQLELRQSQWIADQCKAIPHLRFPNYYPKYSSEKILTMDWMEGLHISEYVAQEDQNKEMDHRLGQTLWNFYMFQIHHLKKVHADPHPGNFLIDKDYNLVALDFGCVKAIPDEFYTPYFELSELDIQENPERFQNILYDLEILRTDDKPDEVVYFTKLFGRLIKVLTLPFTKKEFDFGDPVFWNEINALSETLTSDQELRKMNGNRGSKHFIYINRTFFGLYTLLNDLNAKVNTEDFKKFF